MIISSFFEPRVVITNAWVSPLVKSAEPCTLFNIDGSIDISLISVVLLPSLLTPS